MAGGFEPLHTPFPLACRLVRVLCAIIEIPMLAMLHPWQDLALGGPVALQFISDNHLQNLSESDVLNSVRKIGDTHIGLV